MARNVFNTVSVRKVKSNRFDLSHDVKLSMNMGDLVPVLVQETIPGDKFNIRSETLIRFAPMIAPVMHNIQAYIHYFFVPNRLVWKNWQKFITANNGGAVVPAHPYAATGVQTFTVGSLADYLGIPTGVAIDRSEISAIPFGAYQLICNEFYRDQNLEAAYVDPENVLTDGTQGTFWNSNLNVLRKRAWKHDYFTAALPFAQKGNSVTLPLVNPSSDDTNPVYMSSVDGANVKWSGTPLGGGSNRDVSVAGYVDGAGTGELFTRSGDIQADAATINDLRRAFRLQEWLEKMARGGSRYIEQTLMHFGVRSSDARLNRPEYIGGQKQQVVISEVLQTSDTGGEQTPLGSMAGHALSASSGKNNSYYCEEHGYIIGIMSVIPDSAYDQGIPKHFSRRSYLDYPWPTFAHIGEQEILNKELFYKPADPAYNNGVFGYIPRYSEMRYTPSRVAGAFRDSLSYWHLGRKFSYANPPALNQQFIKEGIRTDFLAVQEAGQYLWCHIRNQVNASRKLPRYGTPTL